MSIPSNRSGTLDSSTALAKTAAAARREAGDAGLRGFLRRGILFVLLGLLLYLAVYALADQLIYRYARRNRFYAVKTAPAIEYDYVILGASHAAVFDYEDMNARLEQMTGRRILNLSVVGSGVTVNRLLLDYFLVEHRTKNVLYFVDSFAFYSADWNEKRLQDVRLFDRAPVDPVLASILLQNPASRATAFDYLVGFSKINNPDRFKSDISEDEAQRFTKTFRPIPQIDRQRIEFLYPQRLEQTTLQRYLTDFEEMLRDLRVRGIRALVVKPPVPGRFYKLLPNEADFDAALRGVLDRNAAAFYDFSLVSNDEKFYFNPDHLNRDGVLNFYENYLEKIMEQ